MTEDASLSNADRRRHCQLMRSSYPTFSACLLVLVILLAFSGLGTAQPTYHLGFDRNDYPGDNLLPALRRTFEWTGYWLNNPPGETSNSWAGKREIIKADGFGFAVLYNGRLYKELKGK